MANDHEGQGDKLSEAVALLGERVTRVEHEQRAMRTSIDQLIGEVRQLDKRLDDMHTQFDKRLGDMNAQFDKRLGDMSAQFDKRLNDMHTQFDRRLGDMSAQFDRRLGDMNTSFDRRLDDMHTSFDKRLGDMSQQFDRRLEALDKRITDVRWVVGVGLGILVVLMTLYRFVHFGSLP